MRTATTSARARGSASMRRAPWSAHYRMHEYVVAETAGAGRSVFPATDARSISGHSMAATARSPSRSESWPLRSVSAFSPIVAPSRTCPGARRRSPPTSATTARRGRPTTPANFGGSAPKGLPLLVDQGEADEFLATQLQPQRLVEACAAAGHPLELRMRPGYDHSYYFIASFIGEHVAHHAAALRRS